MQALHFETATLDNGLVVVGERNPAAQTFAAGYFVKTGARDESPEVAGVSHFLEHMMFKGTDRRTAEDINREFDELGARYNAYTSEDRTVYYGAVLPDDRERLLDLLSDMMRPALRQEDFDVEKKVILEEIAMYRDRPAMQAFEKANERFFAGHPSGNSVLGSDDSIGALARDQMLAYFEQRYAPDNLVLAVAGNYDWDAVVAQARRATAAWSPSRAGREHPRFAPAQGRSDVRDPALRRMHAAVLAPGIAVQDDDRIAAALLAQVIGGGDGSRLHWALIDPGIADSASIHHDAGDGLGTFVGYVSGDEARTDEILGVLAAVLAEAQDGGVNDDEWRRAQRKVATGLTLRAETPFGRLMSLGGAWLDRGAYEAPDDLVARVMATERAQGEALLAGRPFDRRYTLVLRPENGVQAENDVSSSVPDGIADDTPHEPASGEDGPTDGR